MSSHIIDDTRRSVVLNYNACYNLRIMNLLADVAHVSQGLSLFGHGAGVRQGEWTLKMVESRDVRDGGWLELAGLREIGVLHNTRTERHLLRPFDVLVTARAGSVQSALVPPAVSRTVASVTLLVVRPKEPESGMGHYLWYFLTSAFGRSQIGKRMTTSATLTALSAKNLAEVEIPVPSRTRARPGSPVGRSVGGRPMPGRSRRRGCGAKRCGTQ